MRLLAGARLELGPHSKQPESDEIGPVGHMIAALLIGMKQLAEGMSISCCGYHISVSISIILMLKRLSSPRSGVKETECDRSIWGKKRTKQN